MYSISMIQILNWSFKELPNSGLHIGNTDYKEEKHLPMKSCTVKHVKQENVLIKKES